jgi:hypothetical protein
MNRFNSYSQAQFTPLSAADILQPALIQRERHDRMEEQYNALQDDAQKIAFIAENASSDGKMAQD